MPFMKKIFISFIISIVVLTADNFGQRIGDFAPEKQSEVFPSNSWGLDIMFGEGGFGLGSFYRRSINNELNMFVDFSISESKDEREIEQIDYFGRIYVLGKKHRIFLMPLNFGISYRLFQNSLTDNFRPYLSLAAGPTMVAYNPYELEFFSAIGKSKAKFTTGGYIGFGADFGLDKKSLMGLNIRYYVIRFFSEGIESLEGRPKKNLDGFYFTIYLGAMF